MVYFRRRRPLPLGRNTDGRPVWEPPVFGYSCLIGDEELKRREAVVKYTGEDAAQNYEDS